MPRPGLPGGYTMPAPGSAYSSTNLDAIRQYGYSGNQQRRRRPGDFAEVTGSFGSSPDPYLPYTDPTLDSALDNQAISEFFRSANPRELVKGVLSANAGVSTDARDPGNFATVSQAVAEAASRAGQVRAANQFGRDLENFQANLAFQGARANEGLGIAGAGFQLRNTQLDARQAALARQLQLLMSLFGGF